MLRSNQPPSHTRQDTGQAEDYSYLKPSQASTQLQRNSYKENQTDHSPTFKVLKNPTETSESDGTVLTSRLQSIRKKYDYQMTWKNDRENPGDSTPLKDSNRVNRVINSDFKRPSEKETTVELQRSFSFVNKQPVQTKNPPSNHHVGVTENRAYGESAPEPKAQLRKNSSFGLFQDSDKYKFSVNRCAPQDSHKANQFQPQTRATENRYSQYKLRTVSEYNKRAPEPAIENRQTNDHQDRPFSSYADQPRLESIDKINIKIKQILKSIGQSGLEPNEMANYRPTGQIQHQQRPTSVNTPYQVSKHYLKNVDSTQKSGIYQANKSNGFRIPTEAEEMPRKQTFSQYDQTKSFYGVRMKTLESSTTKSHIHKEADCQQGRLSKNLDFEIKKIQDKIKKSQQEKAKLNIRFQELKSSTHLQTKLEAKSASISKNTPSVSSKYQYQPQRRNFDKIEVPKPVLRKSMIPEVHKQAQTSIKVSASPQQVPKAQPFNLKIMKVECQIEEQPRSARESKRFIDNLREQVKLDESLRNAKIWLDSADSVPNKWGAISSVLKQKGIIKSVEQVKQEFQSTLEQHNPFYTTRDTEQTVDSLAQKYVASQNYWETNILKCFDAKQLKSQNFTEDKLDLERKGYLTVEDFVRFLNIETGTFYRNRDLILIFRRLATDKLYFGSMMEAIAKE